MTTPLASILPQPETQFCDANGVPYAGGSVYTYIPATTTPKNTWQDSQQLTLNSNPIVLDSAGRCIMYGTGQYRIILKDSLGNTIYDQLSQDIYGSLGTVAYENIGANLKDDGSGNLVSKITTSQNIVAASTTNLGSLTTNVVTVTGNTTITSFGSSANTANPIYFLTFGGAPLLTYNATSLLLPGSANIQASAGDTAISQYLGSGNWKIIEYQKANGQALYSKSFSTNIQVFYTTGTATYTPSAGMVYAFVQVAGSGGGGGGVNSTNACGGGGGGAGSYTFASLSASTIGSSQTITIGAVGTGGDATGGNGTNGGTCSFGAILTALGGNGASGNSTNGDIVTGARGGASGAGGTNLYGGDGTLGFGYNISSISSSGGGTGGASFLGGGGHGGGGNQAGFNGVPFGSGGGGASSLGGGGFAGGNGAPGIVIITEYIYA